MKTLTNNIENLINNLEADYKVTELKSSARVHSTTNYKSLKFYKANRPIRRHIKGIIESMKKYGNISVGLVAEINGVLYILDGQHRFTACKELGITFEYKKVVLNDTKDIVQLISSLNSNSAKWKDLDYLEAFSIEGVKSYEWLKEVNDDFKNITFSNLKNIFGWKTKEFQDGKWSITKAELFKGLRIVRQLNDIIPILKENGVSVRAQLLRAPIDAMKQPKYNHKKMIQTIINGGSIWSNDETILRTQLLQQVTNF
jgi:hypothetical protein